ncbi:AraC family transcriptional regulator [Aequorivita sp. CIP111184]|uniref:helix-turn-helix domain-containing protein n=1 Tax=Aequorivita sp. CIP111184 TaxID=2211356 RepID=UPI000DBBF7E6|nr:AraC family transcriptional regulator [Aequorivita sp. CIP111184]SRX54297.1 Regulatory protein PchR [Aequorivita sp. CIP111184]
MQTITCHSIPFKEVLNDLAIELETSYTQSCEEYTLIIPEKYGSGSIKGINFKEGLGLLFYNCTFNEDLEIHFIVNEVHPLKFLFCEKGGFSHHFQNKEEQHKVRVLENIIVASNKKNGHVLRFKAGVHTIINSLEINRELFIKTMACQIQSLDSVLEKLFLDTKASEQFYYHGDYSVQMADLFERINSNQLNNFIRTIFLHGSAYKLLTIQIVEYHDSKNSEGNQSLLKRRDQILIMEAAALIENDILDFKTIKKLADHIGLNPTKLQNGFKHIYGTTINEFVQNRRLDLAKNLIKGTDHSFSEIAYMVGISSKSYFSKMFKDKYGLTPSDIRKKKSKDSQR